MAIIADFMLVWLPAPTVSLRPPLAVSAGSLSKFFYGCPDNAFQVILYINIHLFFGCFRLVFWLSTVTSHEPNSQLFAFDILSAGGFGWNILFIFTENRCNSGMYSMIKKNLVVLYNKSEIHMVYINLLCSVMEPNYLQLGPAHLWLVKNLHVLKCPM